MAEPRAQQAAQPAALRDLSGTSVGRFAIHSRLGVGGMGEVYRAEDTKLKRPVALKRIAPHLRTDEHYRQRFLREAELASRLSYEHIAGVYDVFEEGEDTFLVMEYVEGESLRQRLRQPMSVEQFLPIAIQCATALVAAHERGILHRDIKPENIMLTPAGRVKILDFGIAKRLPRADETASVESRSGAFSGTPAYMAPEVLLEKEADARSDIFSLGVVFYEALAGKHPFRADSFVATSNRILHETPAPLHSLNPSVPAELDQMIPKMLAKDAAARYSSAAELLEDLRAIERGSAISPALPAPWVARRGGSLAAVLLIVLMIVSGAAIPSVRQRVKTWLGIAVVPQEKQLAVLPFEALGGDSSARAFGDGLSAMLTAKLTQLTATHALQVVPASEVRAHKVTSAERARQELGVNLVLAGSLQESAGMARVTYELIDARTRRQLRADTITVAAADPFAVQDQVVDGALRMLEIELQPTELRTLAAHGTQVAGAYDFYLQGRGYLQEYDKPENITSAISVFERALALDPDYALAYAGLGEAYWKKYEGTKDAQWVERGRQACEHARSLDSSLAAAYLCLGTLHAGTGQYERAAEEFERAVETEPTSDDAYRGLAYAYERLGKLADAEKTHRRAIALRPHYWAGYNWLGVFYYRQARYQQAAEMFRQVVTLAPDNIRGYYNLATAYMYLGHYEEAIAAAEQSIAIRPTAMAYTDLGNAYFYVRRYVEATGAYEQAVKLNEGDALLWWNLGDGYYWAPGKRAQAAGAYQRAIALAEESLRVNRKDTSALGILAICHAMLGEKKLALDVLAMGLQLAPADPEMRLTAALVYNQFDETKETLAWLEKALAAGYSPTIVRDLPNFEHLRSNQRFQLLLQRN